MAKRKLEDDSSQYRSPFSRGCILLSKNSINLQDLLNHLNSNFDDIIARGEHSKILILDATHGSRYGRSVLTDWTLYKESFMEETCNALGTTHYRHRQSKFPRYQKIYPYQEWLLRDWKRSGEYHYKIDRNQALRKKLHRNGVSVEIANLGHFYGDPKALVQYVKDCDPSAIILNFCYSENSDSRWLLQRSGLLAKVFLKNERVLLTGNRTIQLDLEQEALLNEVEFKLEELRLMSPPGGPRPHVFIQGPAGKHAS